MIIIPVYILLKQFNLAETELYQVNGPVNLVRLAESDLGYTRRFFSLLSAVLRLVFFFDRPIVVAADGHARLLDARARK